MDVRTVLPLVNVSLILISGILLIIGYIFIRRRMIPYHKWAMLSATTFAALFLIVYLTRAFLFESKLFAGEGVFQTIYLAILGSHSVLAAIVGPMALVAIWRALKGDFKRHR